MYVEIGDVEDLVLVHEGLGVGYGGRFMMIRMIFFCIFMILSRYVLVAFVEPHMVMPMMRWGKMCM